MSLSAEIPVEFLPKQAINDDDFLSFGNLFDDADDVAVTDQDGDEATQEVTIAQHTYRLQTPPDVGTLFAHQVWSGSKFLADFLASHAEEYVQGKRTVEFGAGTALPSLVALSAGSQLSVITDYPDETVLQAIKETVGYNWISCGEPLLGRVAVVGHEWGTDTDAVFQAASKTLGTTSTDRDNESDDLRFNLAIFSECLWMHRTHAALAQSLSQLLSQESYAIATYAHHVPGCEEKDDAFFSLCKDYNFFVVHEESQEMAYMWDSGKTTVVHLKILRRSDRNSNIALL